MVKSKKERTESKEETKEPLERLLKLVLYLPKSWLILSTLFVLLSMLNITWAAKTGLSFAFQVSGVTAIFLALIWLPGLLRVFALIGGGAKTPMGEITSSGLGSWIQLMGTDALGLLLGEATTVEKESTLGNQKAAGKIRQEIENEYVERFSVNEARSEMLQLAQRYTQVRIELQSGPDRTILMNSLIERMRVLALLVVFSSDEIASYLRSDDLGKRIVGLSCMRVSKEVSNIDQVLQIIDNPKSAHEQYQALKVIEGMTLQLSETQNDLLQEILGRQRDYNQVRHQWLKPDSDRRLISDHILIMLQKRREREERSTRE